MSENLILQEERKKMADKMKNIPTPKINKKKMDEKNKINDEMNYKMMMGILNNHLDDAEKNKDSKKIYACISNKTYETDLFEARNRVRKNEEEVMHILKTIPIEKINVFEFLIRNNINEFWNYYTEKTKNTVNDLSKQKYYNDIWGLNPSIYSKLQKYYKLKEEIEKDKKIL